MKKIILLLLLIAGLAFGDLKQVLKNNTIQFQVNQMNIDQIKQVRKYGANVDVDANSTPQYVWDGQFEYTYDTVNQTIYLVSSSAADNVKITVEGLVEVDGEWNKQEIDVHLNGTTAVEVGEFIRVFRIRASNAISPLGIVQARTDTTYTAVTDTASVANLRAQISLNPETSNSRNSTLMAMYTVPSGKTAFIYRGFIAVRKLQDAEFDLQIRNFGSVFYSSAVIPIYQEAWQYELGYERVPEKSDIRVKVGSQGNNTQAYSSFHMLVIDNKYLEQE